MWDKRALSQTNGVLKRGLALRCVSLLTAFVFLTTNVTWAQPQTPRVPRAKSVSPVSFSEPVVLPEELGTVQTQYNASGSRPTVIVIRDAHTLSLKALAVETRRLVDACLAGTVKPDELSGATFTVTNLGAFGIEHFTPILNPPQVGILGVGNINLTPVEVDGEVTHIPHIGLSLTINHQVVDGAPGARFLQALARRLAEIDLLVAL